MMPFTRAPNPPSPVASEWAVAEAERAVAFEDLLDCIWRAEREWILDDRLGLWPEKEGPMPHAHSPLGAVRIAVEQTPRQDPPPVQTMRLYCQDAGGHPISPPEEVQGTPEELEQLRAQIEAELRKSDPGAYARLGD